MKYVVSFAMFGGEFSSKPLTKSAAEAVASRLQQALATKIEVLEYDDAAVMPQRPESRTIKELKSALTDLVLDWDSVDQSSLVPDEINVTEHWDSARAALRNAEKVE